MNRRGLLATALGLAPALALGALPTLVFASPFPSTSFEDALSSFLSRHVRWNEAGTATTVDYAGVRRERAALQELLDYTSGVTFAEFEASPLAARQAFLVNAYNVWTLALIADASPDIASIRDLGSLLRSPWKKAFIPFLGETRSLDDIEHGLLRGAPDSAEPRIHFAVNCASIGCPALRPEAYVAARWDAQLDDQTRRFLRDDTRNRVSQREPLRLGISKIFDWYGDDFANDGGVHGFLARYPDELGLSPAEAASLARDEARIELLEYDWSLNAHVDS